MNCAFLWYLRNLFYPKVTKIFSCVFFQSLLTQVSDHICIANIFSEYVPWSSMFINRIFWRKEVFNFEVKLTNFYDLCEYPHFIFTKTQNTFFSLPFPLYPLPFSFFTFSLPSFSSPLLSFLPLPAKKAQRCIQSVKWWWVNAQLLLKASVYWDLDINQKHKTDRWAKLVGRIPERCSSSLRAGLLNSLSSESLLKSDMGTHFFLLYLKI